MLCAPLWINERTLGTLSLYAPQSAAFGEHDKRIIELFATLARPAASPTASMPSRLHAQSWARPRLPSQGQGWPSRGHRAWSRGRETVSPRGRNCSRSAG